jgi:hypothetical protein
MRCSHVWNLKEQTEEGEIFYCQKCLKEVLVRRFGEETEVITISEAVKA